MPTYDYKCHICGTIREIFRNLGEDSEPVCCDKNMERVWTSPPAIQFKGTGFYSTGG